MTMLYAPPFDAEAEADLRRALAAGALMTFPTETTYALGGNGLDAALARRVHALKGRAAGKALLLLVEGEAMAGRLAADIAPPARVLMERFWPGPLTLVVRAAPQVPPGVADDRGTVALRWSPQPVVRELIRLGEVPLIGTSANRSGEAPLSDCGAVIAAFGEVLEVAVDDGPAPGGPPSTLVDTTVMPFRVLREGATPKPLIQAALVETHVTAVPD